MRLAGVEVRTLDVRLLAPVVTSVGAHHLRPVLLVRVVGDAAEGWGESGAMAEGTTVDPALAAVAEALCGPVLGGLMELARAGDGELPGVAALTADLPDPARRMAAAALEMAVLDCGLRSSGRSFADWLGTGGPVEAGAVVGIPADRAVATLRRKVDQIVGRGYGRLRLKIEPGWDTAPVRAVRLDHPDLHLQVDANGAYRLGDRGDAAAERLGALDEFGLDCVEQPLAPDDLASHALLAATLCTPVCLDESLTTLGRLEEAVAMGACEVACIKPSRLGGLLAARGAGELCRAAGVPAFVGGFFETGLGRAANAALAGLDGFTLAGDLSDPADYLEVDPFGYPAVVGGRVQPPTAPGICAVPDVDRLDSLTTDVHWFPAPA
jgi:O-succinylbenzoate synthase